MTPKKAADIVPLDEERRRRAQEAMDQAGPDSVPTGGEDNSVSEASSHLVEDTVVEGATEPRDDFGSAGAMMAAARQSLGLSLEDVAASTNITADRLEAIERMDVGYLPNAPFTLGFVRTYAQVLNLPAEPLIERFRAEAGYGERSKTPTLTPRLQKDLGPPAQVSLIAVIAVIAFLLWIVWKVIQTVAPQETVVLDQYPLAPGVVKERAESYEVGTSLEDSVPLVPDSRASEVTRDDPIAITRVELLEGDPLAQLSEEVTEASTDTTIENAADSPPVVSAPVENASPEIVAENNSPMPTESTQPALTADQLTAMANGLSVGTDDSSEEADMSEGGPIEIVDTRTDRGADEEREATIVDQPVVEEALPQETVAPARTAPVLRLAVEPVYPARCSNRASDREIVTVAFKVSRFGKVINPAVESTTDACFNRAAIGAVSRWDFDPATEAGRPVESETRTTRVVFDGR